MATAQKQETAQASAVETTVKTEEAQEQPNQEMAEENRSNELIMFDEYRDNFADLLINSITSFSTYCLQEDLVTSDMQQQASEELAKMKTSLDKSTALLNMVTNKMDKKIGSAATIWEHFMTSIDDMEEIKKYLSEEKDKGTLSEVQLIRKNMKRLADILKFNLIPVAGKLHQSGVINATEYRLITNSHAASDDVAMLLMMDAIRSEIKRNPKKLEVFIKDVLEEMGGPAEEIAKSLKKELDKMNNPQPPPPQQQPPANNEGAEGQDDVDNDDEDEHIDVS